MNERTRLTILYICYIGMSSLLCFCLVYPYFLSHDEMLIELAENGRGKWAFISMTVVLIGSIGMRIIDLYDKKK